MNLFFKYSKEKDIEAILSGAKSSYGALPTKIFEELQSECNDILDTVCINHFYENALVAKGVNNQYIDLRKRQIQSDISKVIDVYTDIAEQIFETQIKYNVDCYLTISPRCPYSIENKYFFVNIFAKDPVRIILHELWHFYTWQIFGQQEVDKLGESKYNSVKEALTVLLNTECMDLIEVKDEGYMEHVELRDKITNLWKKYKDIRVVWRESSV